MLGFFLFCHCHSHLLLLSCLDFTRHSQRILRTTLIRKVSLMSTLLCGLTPRVVVGSKLVIPSPTSSVKCVSSRETNISFLCVFQWYFSTNTLEMHLLCPLGWLQPASQSESLCSRAAPETGESHPGHTVLPGPAGPPCGVSHMRSYWGYWRCTHSLMVGWVNYKLLQTPEVSNVMPYGK